MAFVFRLTDDGRGLVTDYSGDLTGAELLRSHEERTAAVRASGPVRYVLNDFGDTRSIEIAMDVILEHARSAEDQLPELGARLLIAFVVPPGLAHGLARVWTAHVSDSGWRIELFRDRAEAEAWIMRESGLALDFA